jgi:hypothetical protein
MDRGAVMEDLPHDLESQIGYRIAYGEAARLAEMARFDHGWGRDFAAGVGGEAAAIEGEVLRRVGPVVPPELVKVAIQDVLEHRRPRW